MQTRKGLKRFFLRERTAIVLAQALLLAVFIGWLAHHAYGPVLLDATLWLITVEAVGLVAFPLGYYLLPRLRDRGYSLSKPFGILLIGYLSWILSVLHIVPSVQLAIVALLVVAAGPSAWYAWVVRKELKRFFIRERTAIILGEALFLAVFLGWVAYRAYDPAIDHTEQPMDFAFLNASIRSTVGTPEDPWLRGESVSYYYFGYWMMGVLSKLTGLPSYISYNLSLALIPAMGALGIFGLVYNLVRAESERAGRALASGLGAALLLVVVANLEGVLEFMRANGMGGQRLWDWAQIKLHPTDSTSPVLSALGESSLTQSWRPEEFWWWFRSTRVVDTFDGSSWIDTTIQEFPFFSFMLGDLHPHVMSIPFVALFLAFVWNFLRSPLHRWSDLSFQSYAPIAAMALALGALGFTNMWDLPVFLAVLFGVAVLKAYSARGGGVYALLGSSVPITAAVLGLALLLYLPYFASFFSGQVHGIAPVAIATTRPVHLFIVWALFLLAVIPFILGVFWSTTVREDWATLSLLALFVGFLPYVLWAFLFLENGGTSAGLSNRFFHVLPFAMLISIAVYSMLWLVREDRSSMGKAFALALAAVGLLLIMGPELLYVDDSFGPPNERMNTVFKLYYQAWILLAASAGFTIYYWRSIRDSLSGWRRFTTTLWAGAVVVLLASSLYYPPAAAVNKGDLFRGDATLDGLAYVRRGRPAEYDAIQLIRESSGPDSAVLEAVGEWHDAGLVSRSTGVPTVLNWPGHQLQWRGSGDLFAGRAQDVATIYETQDADEAKSLLAAYRVDYVYVGPRERDQYGTEGLDKFSSFMETVFSRGGVAVYRMAP